MEPQNCLQKQENLSALFLSLKTADEKYQKIIELGQKLPPLSPTAFLPENLVPGCQSLLYLKTELIDGKLYFNAHSEALISKGLAALAILIYSGETPETILTCPPTFLEKIGLSQLLSPTRSNGLNFLLTKIRQEALRAHVNFLV